MLFLPTSPCFFLLLKLFHTPNRRIWVENEGNRPTWESLQISFVSVFSPWQLHRVRKPQVLLEMTQYNFGFSAIWNKQKPCRLLVCFLDYSLMYFIRAESFKIDFIDTQRCWMGEVARKPLHPLEYKAVLLQSSMISLRNRKALLLCL